MALFGLTRSVSPEPLLRGDGLYLRPATPADFSSWTRLRAASRAFLEPWEPTWPDDDLTQAAFRRRLRRQDEDIARDEAYAFLIFDQTLRRIAGRHHVGRRSARRLAVGNAGLLDGRSSRRQEAHDARRRDDCRICFLQAETSSGRGGLHPRQRALHRAAGAQRLPTREGYAREYLKIDGAWRDHVLFALVESDFRARPTASKFV